MATYSTFESRFPEAAEAANDHQVVEYLEELRMLPLTLSRNGMCVSTCCHGVDAHGNQLDSHSGTEEITTEPMSVCNIWLRFESK